MTEPEPVSRRDGRALPYQEGDQPLRNCSECGKVLATYNKHYCYQCLKPTCKRCNKGLPLCPEHFAGLSSDGKEELLSAIRSDRMRAKITFVGLCIFFFSGIVGLIWKFMEINEQPENVEPFVFIFGIMVMGGIVMYSPVLGLDINRLYGGSQPMVLKKHGIKVRYSKFARRPMEICQVSGERTPVKASWNCVACSKRLCVNCHSAA